MDAETLRVRRGFHDVNGLRDERRQLNGPHLQLDLSGDNARHVQDIFDNLREGRGASADDFKSAALFVGRLQQASLQHVGVADDGVQRRPQFMRERGEEIIPQPAPRPVAMPRSR